jgi:hypothetical protein
MLIIPAIAAMRPWSAAMENADAIFRYATAGSADAIENLPRVWAGRGLSIPVAAVAGLEVALGEVLRSAPAVMHHTDRGRLNSWAAARTDLEAGFVSIAGPASCLRATTRFQATRTVVVALADLRGLSVRLTAHLDLPASPRR